MRNPSEPRTPELCPRCYQIYKDYPALSRRDNKTPICSKCGTEEAIFDYDIATRLHNEKAWLLKLKAKPKV